MKRYMKLWTITIVFCIIPFIGLLFIKIFPNNKGRDIEPIKYSRKVVLETQGKKNLYYHLDSSAPLSIVVNRPGLLKLITRLDFSELSKKSSSYTIYITHNNESPLVYHKKTKASALSKYVSSDEKNFPGRIRKIFIKVPEGKHTYTLSLDKDAQYTLKVRSILINKMNLSNKYWAKVIPDKFQEAVLLKVGKKTRSYYLFTKDNPLSFVAEGPTKVKVPTRLIFNKDKLVPEQYAMQVFEDNTLKATHLFKSKPSGTTKYKENEVLIPGIKKTFYIDVPNGSHIYSLVPSTEKNILCRVLIEKIKEEVIPKEGGQ